MSLLPGTRLGPDEILSTLGGGGMGDVYRARDARLGRDVALKVLRDDLEIDSERLRRFEQEARAASALNHPNIVTVFDFSTGGGGEATFLAMELVEGQSVRELLAAGPLPLRRTLQIVSQIAEGLAAAHELGIVHRDLKPENVMVTRDGRAKILDFGLAKVHAETLAQPDTTRPMATRPGMMWGTPGYMAPEQIMGEAVDYRVDQFALGVLLYQCLTGSRPFAGANPFEEMNSVLAEEPTPLALLAPTVPDQLAWVVERLLAKVPGDRYDSTRDLGRELGRLRDTFSSRGFGSGSGMARGRRRSATWRPRLLLGTAAVALLMAGFGLGWWLRTSPVGTPPRLRTLTYSGSDSSPDLSPDRRVMAFVSERDGRRRIWLEQLASGAEAPLTAGVDDAPRFSPDGSSVLFSRVDGERHGLYRVAIVGGEERRLLADATAGDWSPDGRQIAFVRKVDDRHWLLGIVGADGGEERELLRVETNDMGPPSWSPDGRQVVVSNGVALSGAPSELHFVEVTSGRERTVAAGPLLGPPTSPAWLSDSSAVLLPQVDNVRVYHGAMLELRPDGSSHPLFWSLNIGSAAAVGARGQVVFDAASVRTNLREHRLDGGGDRWLTRGYALDRQPRYGADGKRLLFSSNRSGNLDLWELALDTGALRRLTDSPAEDWDPAYVGAGEQIVWSSARSGNLEIWIAAADGSGARQVTHDGVDAENPTATPDGKWLVYVSLNPAHRGIWRIRPDGSEASNLVPGDCGLPEISPDGRYVLYRTVPASTGFGIEVVRLADGQRVPGFSVARKVTPGQGRGIVQGRARWLPDGSGIAFVAAAPAGPEQSDVTGLWVQDFLPDRDTSDTLRPLTGFDLPWGVESFAFSADGRLLTMATGEQTTNLVMAESVAGVE
jgi:Tol biopolymer transport system component